jgi:hypothetical protein
LWLGLEVLRYTVLDSEIRVQGVGYIVIKGEGFWIFILRATVCLGFRILG